MDKLLVDFGGISGQQGMDKTPKIVFFNPSSGGEFDVVLFF